jgi:23S rRNA pseudouridine2605 synthase
MAEQLIRLHKMMAKSGVASLRKAEDMIAAGRVSVNNIVVVKQGTMVSEQDEIRVDGQLITQEPFEYYLLNKPPKTISTVSDNFNRKEVVSLIPTNAKIFPVGRLDQETTGLLLLTNDGQFAHYMMHPSHQMEKTYEVTIRGPIDKKALNQLAQGVRLDDDSTSDPAVVEHVKFNKRTNQTIIRLTITQGRNRIVRRMFKAIHKEVITLHRVRYGFLTLDKIAVGQHRKLKTNEVKRLIQMATKR